MFEQMLAGLQSSTTASAPTRALRSVAVVGTGPLGQALACAALAAGCEVTIVSPFRTEVTRLVDAESLTVTGEGLTGTYRLTHAGAGERGPSPGIGVGTGFDAAVADAEVVVLAVPASTHTTYAGLLARILTRGQTIVLAPGGCFGALEFTMALRRNRCRSEPTIVELATAPYLASAPQPGRLDVLAEMRSVAAAALPHSRTAPVVAELSGVVPAVRAAGGVLETTFADMSGLLVAVPALLSASAGGQASVRERLPEHVVESVLTRLDEERRMTASAYGVRGLPSFVGWLGDVFGAEADDTVSALDEVTALGILRCPEVGDVAVDDAVACCLVPVASAARAAGVDAPVTSALVGLASALRGVDHRRHGRSLAALGLDGLGVDEIRLALHETDRMTARGTTS